MLSLYPTGCEKLVCYPTLLKIRLAFKSVCFAPLTFVTWFFCTRIGAIETVTVCWYFTILFVCFQIQTLKAIDQKTRTESETFPQM